MPSELAKCTIEVVQSSDSNSYISIISLLITVIGWPIVYILGLSSNRKVEVNKSIDQLDEALFELRNFANSLISNDFDQAEYHKAVAMFTRVNNICHRIQQLEKKIEIPKNDLRSLKKVATDELFHSNKSIAVSKILTIQTKLTHHYKKSM